MVSGSGFMVHVSGLGFRVSGGTCHVPADLLKKDGVVLERVDVGGVRFQRSHIHLLGRTVVVPHCLQEQS